MTTEDMPTTNQGPEDATLAYHIPETVAAGFAKVASAIGQATVNITKDLANSGMSE